MKNDSLTNNDAQPFKVTSPYQLNSTRQNSDTFYTLLDLFADKVMKAGHERFEEIIRQYRHSASYLKNEFKQTIDENLLDLLILSVLWNEYKGKWGKNIKPKAYFLNQLYQLRKSSLLKNYVDNIRGKLGEYLLDNPQNKDLRISLKNLQLLSLWLRATHEFDEEVLRINSWISFLETVPRKAMLQFLNEVTEYANWFKTEASVALEKYTSGVNQFLKNHHKNYRGKEDYFFTGRKEVEYHLNMVGAVIMNRNMREEFLSTSKQVLLLPSCMTKNKNCHAQKTSYGFTCIHCTTDCHASLVVQTLQKEGVDTYLIHHSSGYSKSLEKWAKQKETGLIGTACTLNLLSGGFEMKRLGIPGQCVFLDYCGCQKHWTSKGIPTTINIQQIQKTVNLQQYNAG